jgi:hypothetical protein
MSAIEAVVLERRAGAPLFHKAEPPEALKRNQSRVLNVKPTGRSPIPI